MGRMKKLDGQQETAIREALDQGARVVDLARRYDVSETLVTTLLPEHRRRGPRPAVLRDATGEVFGKWTVLMKVRSPHFSDRYATYFLCRCACGREGRIRGAALLRGDTKSCRECAQDVQRALWMKKEEES